jgi:hypothetical protein
MFYIQKKLFHDGGSGGMQNASPLRMSRTKFATLIVALFRLIFVLPHLAIPCVMSFRIRQALPPSINFNNVGPRRHFSRLPLRLFPATSSSYNSNKIGSSGQKATSTDSASDLFAVRKAKIDNIRQAGMEPFAYSFDRNCNAQQLHSRFASLAADSEDESADIRYAGRVMVRRFFGKLAFFDLLDESGRIQLYIDMTRLGSDASAEKKRLIEWTDAGGHSIRCLL